MRINGGPSMTGLQHMAATAQKSRKQAGVNEFKIKDASAFPTPIEDSLAGNNISAAGKKLPLISGAEQSIQKPDHATGLGRAIDRLQQNVVKSPEVDGLQHALEMLLRNQEKTDAVDISA